MRLSGQESCPVAEIRGMPDYAAKTAGQRPAFAGFPVTSRLKPVGGLWPGATKPYNKASVFHARSLFAFWGAR